MMLGLNFLVCLDHFTSFFEKCGFISKVKFLIGLLKCFCVSLSFLMVDILIEALAISENLYLFSAATSAVVVLESIQRP